MTAGGRLRLPLAVLTGLWVTTGVAVPVGFLLLRGLKAAAGGRLGPDLLERPLVILALLAGYGLAAAVGGWAAGWIAPGAPRRLAVLLGAAHAGAWLVVLAGGSAPLPAPLSLALAAAAVAGTMLGVGVRTRRAGRARGVLPEEEAGP